MLAEAGDEGIDRNLSKRLVHTATSDVATPDQTTRCRWLATFTTVASPRFARGPCVLFMSPLSLPVAAEYMVERQLADAVQQRDQQQNAPVNVVFQPDLV